MALPGVTVQQVPGAVVSTGVAQGLVVAVIGAAPIGPTLPTLVGSRAAGQRLFGSSSSYGDIAGWSIPEALDIIYDNAVGAPPLCLIIRAGTTQATVAGPTGTGTAWTLTANPATLGGADGNGTTFQYATGGGGVLTITPPTGSGLATEVYPNLGASPTYASLVPVLGQSKILSISGTDQSATVGTTLATLTGGTAGGNPTLAQIQAAIALTAPIAYSTQPIHVMLPLWADSAASGAASTALAQAITNMGIGQRTQIIGSVAAGLTVAQIGTIAQALTAALDNGGDSGRASLMANYAPVRRDPQTGQPRTFPAWSAAAAYAGMIASLPPQVARGRRPLQGFGGGGGTAFNENFQPSDWNTLVLTNGVTVAKPNGQLIDENTLAKAGSYRTNSVATAEDFWMADLANAYDQAIIEVAAGPGAIQAVKDFGNSRMSSYKQQQLMSYFTLDATPATSDVRQAEVDIQWTPYFALRNIVIRSQLYVPAPASQSLLQAV